MTGRFALLAAVVVSAVVIAASLLHVFSPRRPEASAPAAPSVPASSTDAPGRPLSICRTLLKAAIDGDYKSFRSECSKEGDNVMKLALSQAGSKEAFEKASEAIAPLCRGGYELQFLTSMTQQGSDIYLWKLVPAAGQNQFVVRLTLRDGKIAGFFFQ